MKVLQPGMGLIHASLIFVAIALGAPPLTPEQLATGSEGLLGLSKAVPDIEDFVMPLTADVAAAASNGLNDALREFKTMWDQLISFAFTSRFGFDDYLPFNGHVAYLQSQEPNGILLESDAIAWKLIAPGMKCADVSVACSCPEVSCSTVNSVVRIVSLVITCDEQTFGQRASVLALAIEKLTALKQLTLGRVFPTPVEFPFLPLGLESLTMSCGGGSAQASWRHAHWCVQIPKTGLRYLHMSGLHDTNVNLNLPSLCRSTELRFLYLQHLRIHTLPSCFSELTQLRFLFLGNNRLVHLSVHMPELRTLIANQQGIASPSENGNEVGCKVLMQTGVNATVQSVCPSRSIALPFENVTGQMLLPKLQKLWLDGLFLSGPIPKYAIACFTQPHICWCRSFTAKFPFLESLKLHENQITGPIPPSFQAVDWIKLELQGNELSGTVPLDLFMRPQRLHDLGLFHNPNLEGCIPETVTQNVHRDIKGRKRHQYKVGVPGTQVGVCGQGVHVAETNANNNVRSHSEL